MKKAKVFRVGVIGAGSIAQHCHLPGYKKCGNVELVAFADPALERHKEVLEKFPEMKGYKDYRRMLEVESLDVVSVCAPNKVHPPAAIAALEAGCHVLCEKPMATTMKEADAMIDAARRAQKRLMVGFTHRLFTGPQKCKELLKKKAIGKPFMMRVRFAHGGPYPGWAKDPNTFYNPRTAAGGAMLDMGIHAIDLCLWLFGKVNAVMAKSATIIKKIRVDDNAVLLLEFANGALGYIDVGWTSKPGFNGFEIYGTEGSLICDYAKGLQQCGGVASAGKDSKLEWTMLDDHPTRGGWEIEIPYWMDVVTGKKPLEMDAQAGKDSLAVALAAYQSSKKGKRVVL